MTEVMIKISPRDYLRMKAIAIDADASDALAFVKELLNTVETAASGGLINHLDR